MLFAVQFFGSLLLDAEADRILNLVLPGSTSRWPSSSSSGNATCWRGRCATGRHHSRRPTSRSPGTVPRTGLPGTGSPPRLRGAPRERGRALAWSLVVQGRTQRGRGERHAHRSADRGRRLPRAQRGHPGHRPQGRRRVRPRVLSASGTAGGPLEGDAMPLDIPRSAASCPAAARSSARRGPTRSRSRAASSGSRRTSPNLGVDALIAIGGEDTLGVATKLHELGVKVVGVPKTIDNDLSRHRLHVRLRHRGQHRDRGHRPAAHHGRDPPPRPDRRGHGPPRGLDRAARRPGGGANVILIPEKPFDIDQVVPVRGEPVPAPTTRRSSSSPRAPCRPRATWCCRARSWTRSATSASAASALAGRGDREAHRQGGAHHRARARPARRHADRVRPGARHPFGLHAIDAVHEGDWGKMVALRGTDIVRAAVEATAPVSPLYARPSFSVSRPRDHRSAKPPVRGRGRPSAGAWGTTHATASP